MHVPLSQVLLVVVTWTWRYTNLQSFVSYKFVENPCGWWQNEFICQFLIHSFFAQELSKYGLNLYSCSGSHSFDLNWRHRIIFINMDEIYINCLCDLRCYHLVEPNQRINKVITVIFVPIKNISKCTSYMQWPCIRWVISYLGKCGKDNERHDNAIDAAVHSNQLNLW